MCQVLSRLLKTGTITITITILGQLQQYRTVLYIHTYKNPPNTAREGGKDKDKDKEPTSYSLSLSLFFGLVTFFHDVIMG